MKLLSWIMRRKTAEGAFRGAVESLPDEVRPRQLNLSGTEKLRELAESYELAVFPTGFALTAPGVKSEVPGVIVSTVAPVGNATTRITVPFLPFALQTPKYIEFRPRYAYDLSSLPLRERLSSFSHLVLLKNGNRVIVFMPGFQKVIGLNRMGKFVDHFVGVHGPDRHLLHLGVAQKIVEQMRKSGIDAELHLPAPEHLYFPSTAHEATQRRAKKPLEELQRHFEAGSIQIGEHQVKTINLSRPKNH